MFILLFSPGDIGEILRFDFRRGRHGQGQSSSETPRVLSQMLPERHPVRPAAIESSRRSRSSSSESGPGRPRLDRQHRRMVRIVFTPTSSSRQPSTATSRCSHEHGGGEVSIETAHGRSRDRYNSGNESRDESIRRIFHVSEDEFVWIRLSRSEV